MHNQNIKIKTSIRDSQGTNGEIEIQTCERRCKEYIHYHGDREWGEGEGGNRILGDSLQS